MPLRVRRGASLGAALTVLATSAIAAAQVPQPAPTWGDPAATAPPPAMPPPVATAPPPADFPPSLQAGGLTPPSSAPPAVTTPPPSQTEKDLDKAKEEDSKRGLEWFWINAEGGFSHVDMRTFVVNDKDFTVGFMPTQAVGATAGVGLGVRLLFITLGARGRIGFYDPWQMFNVGGEIGFHIPLGRVEPHFELGGGYTGLGSASALVKGSSDAISISGGYGRISGGIDVYVTRIFSIGVQASGDFLALVRPGLSAADIQKIKDDPSIASGQRAAADGLGLEGSSYGTAVGVTGVLGLHF